MFNRTLSIYPRHLRTIFNFLWKIDSPLLGFEPETSLIVSRYANNCATITSWKQRMLRITQLILLNKKKMKMFLLPNQFSLKRFFVFRIYSQIIRYRRHLFWVGHKLVVLWTKVCSLGNLVLKIAASKGISNLFLLCVLVAKSVFLCKLT